MLGCCSNSRLLWSARPSSPCPPHTFTDCCWDSRPVFTLTWHLFLDLPTSPPPSPLFLQRSIHTLLPSVYSYTVLWDVTPCSWIYTEDGGSRFFRNLGTILLAYIASYGKSSYSLPRGHHIWFTAFFVSRMRLGLIQRLEVNPALCVRPSCNIRAIFSEVKSLHPQHGNRPLTFRVWRWGWVQYRRNCESRDRMKI
jgi:hypothetical protein